MTTGMRNWYLIQELGDWLLLLEWSNSTDYWNWGLILATGMGFDPDDLNGELKLTTGVGIDTDHWNGN